MLRAALPGDASWIAELRAVVMRPDLERLGRYDATRVRQRFLDAVPFRLNVLQGSPARRLYERHGFVFEHEDPIDVWMVRHPADASSQG